MISTSGHLIPKFPEVRFHRTRIFIFGCAANLEDSGCIGDVENGLSKECIKRLRKIGKEGNMCSKCSFAVKCQSKNCIMNSLAYSGTVGEHNPDMCYFERKKRNLWEIYAPQL